MVVRRGGGGLARLVVAGGRGGLARAALRVEEALLRSSATVVTGAPPVGGVETPWSASVVAGAPPLSCTPAACGPRPGSAPGPRGGGRPRTPEPGPRGGDRPRLPLAK